MAKKEIVNVQGTEVSLLNHRHEDYTDFNVTEFGNIKNESNSFVLTSKEWIEKTNAIGIIAKTGHTSRSNGKTMGCIPAASPISLQNG